MSQSTKTVFGIDLGTTYSSVAYVNEYGKAVLVPNAEGERVTPSVVFFDGDNIVVGTVAKESALLYPEAVAACVKRGMGEPDFLFFHGDKTYHPEEISSFILRKLVQDAQSQLDREIKDVVITCPAYFGINEREATKVAGELAGLNVLRIINEPTAAAIAYGNEQTQNTKNVLVFDLGGGTFDITLIHVSPTDIKVLSTSGDHNLGGKDWDDRIVGYLVEEFKKQTGTDEDILEDPDTWQDLQISAERTKKVLSQREKSAVAVTHGGQRQKMEMTREIFEKITSDLLERTMGLTTQVLENAKEKGVEQVDELIMVGGATRMPQVARKLEEEFGLTPLLYDPDEAVAKGAAIFGWKLATSDEIIERIASKKNTTVEEIREQESLDEQVLEEAAREVAEETGGTLPAIRRSMVRVSDVTSKSFGVIVDNKANQEGVFNVISRNTPVPAQAEQTFFTAINNQRTVLIRITETETDEQWVPVDTSVEIGNAVFHLPQGLVADSPVQMSFSLTAEGRLEIQAQETNTGKAVEVSVETTSVISGEELEKARKRCQDLRVH